jgi:23S rRNA (cytidine1920-2'-O)/16S rRNA (cytidine1409-2'-O)-methyltransferase
MAGRVRVDDTVQTSSGLAVREGQVVVVNAEKSFVGRGAYKLLTAIDRFKLEIVDKVCADVGSSTGGFTDVLLRGGAQKVYCIDSAKGELDWGLRNDPRVEVYEGNPVQQLTTLPDTPSLVVIDLSLMSLKVVIPIVQAWLASDGEIVALLKPQYEAKKEQLPPGAVISNRTLQVEILTDVLHTISSTHLTLCGLVPSDIRGASGNQEFLVWMKRGAPAASSIDDQIQAAISELPSPV